MEVHAGWLIGALAMGFVGGWLLRTVAEVAWFQRLLSHRFGPCQECGKQVRDFLPPLLVRGPSGS